MLVGAVSCWLEKGWKVLIRCTGHHLLDILIGHGLLQYRNQAFGIDPKQARPSMPPEKFTAAARPARLEADQAARAAGAWQRWRCEFPEDAPPKMIFVNCGGGGLRATMFVMDALQKPMASANGQLMHTQHDDDGGIGRNDVAAYYRELYRMEIAGYSVNRYVYCICHRSLEPPNAIAYMAAVSNDLFFPGSHTPPEGISYRKDRGYMFEKLLHENAEILSCFILFRPATRMSIMSSHSVAAHVP